MPDIVGLTDAPADDTTPYVLSVYVIDPQDGATGSDRLNGGDAPDPLRGFAGIGILIGGPGQDNRDFIDGFVHGQDRIDLVAIDADSRTAANDAFAFIGNLTFSGTPSELRFVSDLNLNSVEAEVNGDGAADIQIFVNQTDVMQFRDFIL